MVAAGARRDRRQDMNVRESALHDPARGAAGDPNLSCLSAPAAAASDGRKTGLAEYRKKYC